MDPSIDLNGHSYCNIAVSGFLFMGNILDFSIDNVDFRYRLQLFGYIRYQLHCPFHASPGTRVM